MQRLCWVDCDRKQMLQLDPDRGTVRTIDLPGSPASYAFCRSGEILLAYRTRLTLFDPPTGSERIIDTPMIDFSVARFNDGACDRAGRFWVGTMHKGMSEPVGALYRVDPDLSVRQMADGLTVSNGIAFSPDDKVMYHTDSRASVIYAYDFDVAAGAIAGRRVFADFRGRQGIPDGCTTDRDGRLWGAILGGGRVEVLDAAGRLVRSLAIPTTRPTSPAFGGPSLDMLYVTSMRLGLSEAELAAQPEAGSLFAFDGLGQGLQEPLFGDR